MSLIDQPVEIISLILKYLPGGDIDSWRAVKITCRRMNVIAADLHRWDGEVKPALADITNPNHIRYARRAGLPSLEIRKLVTSEQPGNLLQIANNWPEAVITWRNVEHIVLNAPSSVSIPLLEYRGRKETAFRSIIRSTLRGCPFLFRKAFITGPWRLWPREPINEHCYQLGLVKTDEEYKADFVKYCKPADIIPALYCAAEWRNKKILKWLIGKYDPEPGIKKVTMLIFTANS